MKFTKSLLKLSLISLMAISSQQAMALSISTGEGNYGTGTANGSVTAPPGALDYLYVSTAGSSAISFEPFGFTDGIGDTTGSRAVTQTFTANAGDSLSYNFNFVTSDGGYFADFAYIRLLNAADNSQVAILTTARVSPDGQNVVSGQYMGVTPEGITAPASIQGGATWDELGSDSTSCYANSGCGNTGWLSSLYSIKTDGNYVLEFGVVNWNDTEYASGLAIGNIAVTPVPEPETYAMMLAGLALLGVSARRRIYS